MAIRNALVLINGAPQELPAGDTLAGNSGGGGGSTPTNPYGFDRPGFVPIAPTIFPGIYGPLTNFGTYGANTLNSGSPAGGASPNSTGDGIMLAVINNNTSSSPTGASHLVTGYNASFGSGALKLGIKTLVVQGRSYLGSLPTSTENYTVQQGISVDRSNAPANFVGFRIRYDGGSSAVLYQAVSVAASTETATNVTLTATAFFDWRVEVNAARTSATYYINNTLVATITTNIPANTVLLLAICGIVKTAGTSLRNIYTRDFWAYYCD